MKTFHKVLTLCLVGIVGVGQATAASTPEVGEAGSSKKQPSKAFRTITVNGRFRGGYIDLQTSTLFINCRGHRNTCYTLSEREGEEKAEIVVYNAEEQPVEKYIASPDYDVKQLGSVEGEEEVQYTFYGLE